ncbi:3-isopropylmalate dehydratase small subunit [Anoxynatronum buryatiense]|uniref:3-isopropylmalate dehydratase small subunit n=1 Tax=Anoxynatronum buryatiense TaxID=489973 RepID=A0AA45WX59_9CLOT|nr:3-isopropylmalate dehydratase small subunit [Anoxynatronum buryatiense]SMP62812.1 3-isopropylmalate dehydratase, small subunit [Anoxynatronum buryatiense]
MKIDKGTVHVVGDHIDTDQIYPGRYIEITNPAEIADHCLEGVDPALRGRMKPGDFVVAGQNFGCGSSREHAAITLLHAGVGAVVAESFARIFYRNAINLGLPVIVCPGVFQKVTEGDEISLDVAEGLLINHNTGETLKCEQLSTYVMEILSSGGIKPLFRKRLLEKND